MSAQSDLNRPNCPGRAARYRYIMGAKSSGQIVKDPGTLSGAGEIRTLALRVKSSLCNRYTTTPNMVAVSVSIVVAGTLCVLL